MMLVHYPYSAFSRSLRLHSHDGNAAWTHSEQTSSLVHSLNVFVARDPSVPQLLLPILDGISIIQYRDGVPQNDPSFTMLLPIREGRIINVSVG